MGYTDISIAYHRPVARGRTLFGGVVRWGRVWNPGADSATVVTFSKNVVVEGVPAFYFPVVAPDSAVLRMHWSRTVVPLRVRVDRAP